MGRWVMFLLGSILIIITLIFANYHATYPDDALSIIILQNNSAGESLWQVDMLGRQTRLDRAKSSSIYEITHFSLSPDERWLLVLFQLADGSSSTLQITSLRNFQSTTIYRAGALFDYPLWTADSQEIVIAGYTRDNIRGEISVKRLTLEGEVKETYTIDAEKAPDWNLSWFNADTLWLTPPLGDTTGYFVDLPTGITTAHTALKNSVVDTAVSPDGKWVWEVASNEIVLKDWDTQNVQWTIAKETLPFDTALQIAWSGDSQWVAFLNYETAFTQADVYMANIADRQITQLTDDSQKKSLVFGERPTDSQNSVFASFSPNKQWLLYADELEYSIGINAVSTDGSGASLNHWFAGSGHIAPSVKWGPVVQTSMQATKLTILGGVLVLMSLMATIWQWRQQS